MGAPDIEYPKTRQIIFGSSGKFAGIIGDGYYSRKVARHCKLLALNRQPAEDVGSDFNKYLLHAVPGIPVCMLAIMLIDWFRTFVQAGTPAPVHNRTALSY